MLTAAVAAGMGAAAAPALAADGTVSERDMLTQAVALYEKLSGTVVEVPKTITDLCGDEELGKAVVLGFANADEVGSISDAISLRKQDAITVLYKTIIDFDDSFALSSDEIDEIMNGCYDNALVDEENRAGFAFMLKFGIIDSGLITEPNKEITWDGCRILINELYDRFVQNVEFNVGGVKVRMGANIETVTDILGSPARIDKGDYGYDWYIFNTDYNYFMMVGVDNGRICAFYSNARHFSFDGISTGDSIAATFPYADDEAFRFTEDSDGKVDSVFYNTRQKSDVIAAVAPETRAFELADMINAYRVRNGHAPIDMSASLLKNAQDMAPQAKYTELARDGRYDHIMDGAQHEIAYDTFALYSVITTADSSDLLSAKLKSIGIGTSVNDDLSVTASVITSGSLSSEDAVAADNAGLEAVLPQKEEPESAEAAEDEALSLVSIAQLTADVNSESAPLEVSDTKTEEKTATPAASDDEMEPDDESSHVNTKGIPVADGKDFVIAPESEAITQYYVKIYSYEEDMYIVNSYIPVVNNKLTLGSKMFVSGRDYLISVSPVTDAGIGAAEEFVIAYGTVENAVSITSPATELVTDDDHLNVEWSSDLYSCFIIDVYDEDGKMALTKTVTDATSANIKNIEPGKYSIHIYAIRRGSKEIIKADSGINVEVRLPEPVITEYILEDGEKFFPVYEDEEMGLVYFYDEDIIDTDINGKKVKRKKITQKQVKATDLYKLLAKSQQKVEYFTGGASHDLLVDENGISLYNRGMFIESSSLGRAIVAEAEKYLGIPYLWGGTTTNGFDCSGLCQYVYRNLGINISRVSQSQYLEGIPVSRDELQPGDLVFFQKNGNVHHVGIYAGGGMMIHAPYTGTVVQYQSIDTPYYAAQFCGGRRIYHEEG